jgi:hypothetical protein
MRGILDSYYIQLIISIKTPTEYLSHSQALFMDEKINRNSYI